MVAAAPGPADEGVQHHRRRLDVRVVPHRRRSPFRLRDWRMRSKLAAVLILPSVAFLVLASEQTSAVGGRAGALDQFAEQVRVGRQITALVDGLQQERDRTAGELAAIRVAGRPDPGQPESALRPLWAGTDRAVTGLREAARPLLSADASWRVSYARVIETLDRLPDVRDSVPAAALNAATLLGNYDRAVDALLALLAEPSPGADQPELTDAVLRSVQLARTKEIASRIRSRLYAAARAGRYNLEDLVQLTDLRAQQLTAVAGFRLSAAGEQLRRYDEIAARPEVVAATQLEERTIPSGGSPAVLQAGAWWASSQKRQALLREVEAGVLADAVGLAEERSAALLRRTLLFGGAVLGVLVVALLISVLIGRSIARSLRMLRRQALQVAQRDLPDALERLRTVSDGSAEIEVAPAVVRSLDEIGEVAEAFVAVHRSAVTLAVEQAVMRRRVNAMFVNLARRSQVLVERQLELLDDLERDESDPDQLENLFKLDHLAARMRRNDESLLVLAGSESSRRWSQPVPLAAVMLAAVAEIEQYQRVRHQVTGQLYVVGHGVADLVHLLAELLENASAFSPPDTVVRITGHPDTTGAAVVEIADDGLGMGPTALAEANALLAVPPAADVAASERMGLFVVSHLAARHGIRVRLCAAERGLVAEICLPPTMLARPPAQADLHEPTLRMRAAMATWSQ
ncbi:MAG TPA: nitrate- and nitrite sensing domain-containing protein, partial [Micromonospora sp.]